MAAVKMATDSESRSGGVLVVEDDTPTRLLLGSILTDQGIAHQLTANGPEALRVSAEVEPALVLLDIHLPYLDGELVAEALREKLGPDLPILAMSASLEEAAAERIGAYGFLPKPFELEDLLAQVRRGLALAARSDQARRRSNRAIERLRLVADRQDELVQLARQTQASDQPLRLENRRLNDLLLEAEFLLVQLVTLHRARGPHRDRQDGAALAALHRRLDDVEHELRLRGSGLGLDAGLTPTLGDLRRRLAELTDRRRSTAPFDGPERRRTQRRKGRGEVSQ